MLIDEIRGTDIAPGFLVAQQCEDDVAGWLEPFRNRAEEGGDEHRDAAFHVEGAPAPYVAIDQLAGERRVGPLLPVRGNDVDVAVEQKRRRVAPTG